MPMRLGGLSSGMDTESIIKELVAVKQMKVDDAKRAQTKLEWKQEAWKDLNSKLAKLYNGTLGNLRFSTAYTKKTTAVSKPDFVNVITGEGAMNSVQTLKINMLAKAGYLTGGKVTAQNGETLKGDSKVSEALGVAAGSKFELKAGGKETSIEITESTTVNDLLQQLRDAGVTANFDESNQRFYIAAKTTGDTADFTMTAVNGDGLDALDKLGILTYDSRTMEEYGRYAAMGANAAARQSEIDARVTERLLGYALQQSNLKDSLQKYTDNNAEIAQKAQEEYGVDIALLTQADKDVMKNRIAELEGRDTLTDAETAELAKAKGIMSYVDSYDDNRAEIDSIQTELNGLSGYINEDGQAGVTLTAEVEAYVDAKIAQALAVTGPGADLSGSADAHRIVGQDAQITLNNANYTSSSNTFEINGLTITCTAETAADEEITLTTQDDTSGIYDMIKSFITEYSTLMNEMDKLYNADSIRGYEPLTDEEKDAMSDTEVEKWEKKIRDSLLRKDSVLGTVSSAMRQIMSEGVEVNGKKMYLSDFGIETLGYFEAGENEHNAYHINGDEDDDYVGKKPNDLMAMIASDPETVSQFFMELSRSLYGKVSDLMTGTEYSSSFTVYEDKRMKEEYDDYTVKIKELEAKLKDYEDKWYAKFAAMETAMAKLQSNASAVTGLLGGS